MIVKSQCRCISSPTDLVLCASCAALVVMPSSITPFLEYNVLIVKFRQPRTTCERIVNDGRWSEFNAIII